MKIRQGFVSNSSSSSFCIYGCCIEENDIDAIDEKLKEKNIYIVYGPYDSVYIGREFTSIKDDETGKQFKENVEKEIEEVLGEKRKCSTFEEGWYDG